MKMFAGALNAITAQTCVLLRLMENGQEEKAAAIAIFFLKMKKALEILSTSAANTSENGECGSCPMYYHCSISVVNASENGECGSCPLY